MLLYITLSIQISDISKMKFFVIRNHVMPPIVAGMMLVGRKMAILVFVILGKNGKQQKQNGMMSPKNANRKKLMIASVILKIQMAKQKIIIPRVLTVNARNIYLILIKILPEKINIGGCHIRHSFQPNSTNVSPPIKMQKMRPN